MNKKAHNYDSMNGKVIGVRCQGLEKIDGLNQLFD
jgi:hypothetical protein